jgi:signal transduction histidine kinase/CheY-like chemotaxis protein
MLDTTSFEKSQGLQSGPLTRNGELHFRSLLEKLPAGAYTCNPDGLITYFNQHAVQLWGRSPKLNDPVDRFCGSFKLYATDGTPIRHEQCWMALALKDRLEYNGHEILIERPDGQRRTSLAYANPIYDESNNLIGAVNVLVDISDRKLAEEALKQADRSKNEFLATLAHELRNPLAPIRAAVRILQLKADPTPESQSALEVIDRQTRQMTRLIDDLLDIARITSNKLSLRTERVELGELLGAAVETSRPLIEQRGLSMTVDSPSEPVYLEGDFVRLAQIVANLLNNAAKYTDHGGQIFLAATVTEANVNISVRDTGIGIPAEVLPQIFEMFAQANLASVGARGGLGIGLTLVRRLVEMHGGSITASSAGANRGSEFVVRLPLTSAPTTTAPQLQYVDEVASGRLASHRILVVDDNRDSAESLGLLLRLMGHDVRSVYDGVQALEAAKEFRPRVVLLDIGLPDIPGYEVARRLKEETLGEGTIVIAISGWGRDSDKANSEAAGFDHHLVKPVEADSLSKLLAEVPEA